MSYRRLSIQFLCTGISRRSQLAEGYSGIQYREQCQFSSLDIVEGEEEFNIDLRVRNEIQGFVIRVPETESA